MKFEITITAWDDGLFKGRKSITITQDDPYVEHIINTIDSMIEEDNERKRQQAIIDDDIPF